MLFYTCKVRLGTVNNEVRKGNDVYRIGRSEDDDGVEVRGVSAPEIGILRHLHGMDSVLEITKVDDKKVQGSVLREHLKMLYTKTIEHGGHEVPLVDFLFPPSQALPVYVSDAMDDADDEADAKAIAPPPSTRKRETLAGSAA